jgi:hypothetical protein
MDKHLSFLEANKNVQEPGQSEKMARLAQSSSVNFDGSPWNHVEHIKIGDGLKVCGSNTSIIFHLPYAPCFVSKYTSTTEHMGMSDVKNMLYEMIFQGGLW